LTGQTSSTCRCVKLAGHDIMEHEVADSMKIFLCQRESIDMHYVDQALRPLAEAKDAPHVLFRLKEIYGTWGYEVPY